MYKKKLEEDIRCPLEYGLDVFGGKWKSRIICVWSGFFYRESSENVMSQCQKRDYEK